MAHRKRRSIDALTGVRGFGALWVVLHHLREFPYHLDFGIFEPLMVSARLAVDMFFILSGFIMAYVYQGSFSGRLELGESITFLKYRVARMYPVHLLTVLWMLPVYWVGKYVFDTLPQGAEAYAPMSLLANLFMVHEWFPGVGAPNAPAWSISAEWFAYVLFPFLAVAFSLLRTRRGAVGHWPLVVALAACLVAEAFSTPARPLLRVTTGFVFGMAMFERRQVLEKAPAVASLFFFGLLAVMIYSGNDTRLGIIIPILGGMLLSLTRDRDWGARALSTRPMMYLGEISYSIYMVHWLVVTIIRRGIPAAFPGAQPTSVFTIVGGVLATIALAAVVHRWVEVPGRRWLRKKPLASPVNAGS